MAITPLPTPPSTQDPVNFDPRTDAFLAALPLFVTEANAMATTIGSVGTAAAASATAAAASVVAAAAEVSLATTQATIATNAAAAAAASVTAPLWISGQTYTGTGTYVISPANSLIYRHITASSNLTTDPSLDPTNWVNASNNLLPAMSGNSGKVLVNNGSIASWSSYFTMKPTGYWYAQKILGETVQVTSSTTLSPGRRYVLDSSLGSFTALLPSTPAEDDVVYIDARNSGGYWITIGGNGSQIESLSEDMDVTDMRTIFSLVYETTRGWVIA